jgi:hypothetical protein
MNDGISFTWVIVGAVFLWLIILIVSIASLFKRKDMAMPMRIIWLIVILMFPVVGLIVYLVIGGRSRNRDAAKY